MIPIYEISNSLSYLPESMQTDAAFAMLAAIGLQESRFRHRLQIRGPARGYWQFERIGLVEVTTNRLTVHHLKTVCTGLNYPFEIDLLFEAIAHNDTLACCVARLMLWPDPKPLPRYEDGPEPAWGYYLKRWRPGKPHRQTWDTFWLKAWDVSAWWNEKA